MVACDRENANERPVRNRCVMHIAAYRLGVTSAKTPTRSMNVRDIESDPCRF
jgi:hypothetical protein